MVKEKERDYDLELSSMLKQFESFNLLTTECKESGLFENSQATVTTRWVDNLTLHGEYKDANS